MLEFFVLLIFCISLFLCVWLDASVLYALVFGFLLFFAYGLFKKNTVRKLLTRSLEGIKTVKNILITFVLIGIITAIWRASGTIPFIVYYSTALISPHAMVLITFLLCCLISCLTGTAFGTAATMGVICTAIANSMGIPIFYTGGAVLAGSFFGDRCSPMSTSALLVSTLTGTDIFKNISNMIKSSAIPFIITCGVYAVMGARFNSAQDTAIHTLLESSFNLHPSVILPAAIIIVFSLFRINVKITMCISIICGALICFFVQDYEAVEILKTAVFGYAPESTEVYTLLSGGGILSMKNVIFIICISSCYAGIFECTGLLTVLRNKLTDLSCKLTPYAAVLVTSVLTNMIACNQTLAIMLTHQLCKNTEQNNEKTALYLENSAVLTAPLIPWSIACAVPLTSVGAPWICILAACYLYLVPICSLISSAIHKKKAKQSA